MVASTICLEAPYNRSLYDDNLVANEFLFNHLFKKNVPPVRIAEDEESRLLEIINAKIDRIETDFRSSLW